MKTSKSSMFLMELIIAILFFSLASAVCIQLFVKSHLLSSAASDDSRALLLCQNLSEIYQGILPQCNPDRENAKEIFLSVIKGDPDLQSPLEPHVEYENGLLEKLFINEADTTINLLEILPESFFSSLPEETFPSGGQFAFLFCFDADWNNCSFENSTYQVLFLQHGNAPDSGLSYGSSFVFKTGSARDSQNHSLQEIYHLNICRHIPERMK